MIYESGLGVFSDSFTLVDFRAVLIFCSSFISLPSCSRSYHSISSLFPVQIVNYRQQSEIYLCSNNMHNVLIEFESVQVIYHHSAHQFLFCCFIRRTQHLDYRALPSVTHNTSPGYKLDNHNSLKISAGEHRLIVNRHSSSVTR